ncbi:MAG: rod shape-determining protein MreC [Anaerocolumna aminovalerica]|uniref:rod shape-determining protein MreC n=1 Tax=Anaerocolumna aminovalerica TaxID=1527 RepID=UPI00290CA172|nr:rod shape-determining protein MreC [Anaerocolumna aminovalerica]MDU6263073.1 rod shape-determining protein MreC [Anaerocolumna aminovalerica]
MNKKRKKIKIIITCGIIVLVLLFIVFNAHIVKNYTIIPMQKGINSIGTWIYEKENNFIKRNELISENKKLQKKIDTLSIENKYLLQDKYELIRLKKLYEVDKKYPDYDKIGAQVIDIDENFYSNFLYNVFTINKGSNDGIKEGMNVIAENGLVGIIIETEKNSSKVSSIIDNNSNVSAMNLSAPSKSNNLIVSGNIDLMRKQNAISFYMLSDNKDIKVGDQIVTSDISSKYLEGLLIGYVSDITLNNNNLTVSGRIIPSVDFEHINEVLVIKNLKQ